jgi:predicted membrane protein
MVLWKCIFAGLLAVVIAAIVLPMGFCAYLAWTVRPGRNEAIGFDPISIVRSSPSVWVIAALVFGLGFYLQYRRLKARARWSARN